MWNSTKKTVYDPCPPGFRVPPASIFYGFSKKTGNTGSAKTIVSGSGDEAGKMNMYQDVDDLNGMTQRNGAQSKGGYFYLKADETRRYGVDDGVVGGVRIVASCGFAELEQAAVQAVKRARFTPARRGSANVPATARLSLTFRLKD